MCPKRWNRLPTRQSGFLLPVAMFIVVVMGLAALALYRTTGQSSIASVQEVITTQALYAAESGLQTGLSELFYPDVSKESDVNSRCIDMGTIELDFAGISGLNLCEVDVTCQCTDGTNTACTTESRGAVYTLQSVGTCGEGNIYSERTLELSASLEANP